MKEECERLHLTSVATQLDALVEAARQQQLSYEAFLRTVLRAELAERDSRAHQRRKRAARLPFGGRLEAFDFRFQPSVSERLISELASLNFVQTATNILLLGPPGVGKTHLACGLALRAMEAGHSALFVTLRDLCAQLETPGRSCSAVLKRYLQPTVLILDEIGYTRMSQAHATSLFELIAARYQRRPTILTSNLTFTEWGALVGDEVLATALLDRLLHHAEVLTINGRSYRMRERMEQERGTALEEDRQPQSAIP